MTEVSPFRIDPAECVVDPLSPKEIEALVTSEVSGAEAPTITHDGPFAAPDGEPADPATTEVVTMLFRQFWACQNAGEWARFFALHTGEAARRSFSVRNITGLTSQPVAPFPLDQRTAIFAILRRTPPTRLSILSGAVVVVITFKPIAYAGAPSLVGGGHKSLVR